MLFELSHSDVTQNWVTQVLLAFGWQRLQWQRGRFKEMRRVLYCTHMSKSKLKKTQNPWESVERRKGEKRLTWSRIGNCRKITGQFYRGSLFPHLGHCQNNFPRCYFPGDRAVPVTSASCHSRAGPLCQAVGICTVPHFPQIKINLSTHNQTHSPGFLRELVWLKMLHDRLPATLHQPQQVLDLANMKNGDYAICSHIQGTASVAAHQPLSYIYNTGNFYCNWENSLFWSALRVHFLF